MRSMPLDIHNYDKKFMQTEAQVRTGAISERNKELIFRYRDACLLAETCGRVRLIRVMGVLLLFGQLVGKDFDQATRDDLQQLLTTLMAHQPPYSPETLSTYKSILKRFYTWLANPNEFSTRASAPPLVSWIATHVRVKDKKKLQRNELLLPSDVEKVVEIGHTPRDKALVAVMWETGARIAEVGNLQLKHVTKAEYGYTLDLNGKTGMRTVLVVSSAPLLTTWLNVHPFRNNPEAPLWTRHHYDTEPQQMKYDTIRNFIVTQFRRVGITKRVYPHLFRHSRSTYVLASGLMTEAQAKAYFGWTPNTRQLATYAHLLASDANAAILRENNLAPKKEVHDELQPVTCYRCNELNPAGAEYCAKCSAVLDLRRAYEHQQLHTINEDLIVSLFKVLVKKGLVDDAARQVHDAGLGSVLKRLALHASGEHPITGFASPPVNQTAKAVKENDTRETKPPVSPQIVAAAEPSATPNSTPP